MWPRSNVQDLVQDLGQYFAGLGSGPNAEQVVNPELVYQNLILFNKFTIKCAGLENHATLVVNMRLVNMAQYRYDN